DIASLLLQASRADDTELRAGAQLLFPLYGIGLDAETWRRDVLRRGDLLVPAACLLLDESLPPAEFTALFSETVLKARSTSRDPKVCALRGFVSENGNENGNESEDEEAGRVEDPYCRLLAGAIRYGPMLSEEGSTTVDGGRSREIAAWTRSSSAPPEIRLQARIARAQYGNATEAELLELWSDRDLPWSVRRIALGLSQAPKPAPDLASAFSRELRVAGRSAAEESALLSALHAVDPDEAARIALERWENGEIAPGGEPDQAGIWVKSLPAARIASDPKLRATLKALLKDDGVGPQVAAALARAGDAEALPPLLRAVRTGCLT
ncbi:MAG: hypothetical protein ABIT01_16735, partial [Thermoanaerobaculia bacterium]